MKSFIYDKYGYDIQEVNNDVFIFQDYIFKIINIGDMPLQNINSYLKFIIKLGN